MQNPQRLAYHFNCPSDCISSFNAYRNSLRDLMTSRDTLPHLEMSKTYAGNSRPPRGAKSRFQEKTNKVVSGLAQRYALKIVKKCSRAFRKGAP